MNNLISQEKICKIFVGGLTWNTTREMLYDEFIKYGEIIDSTVVKNLETGTSRGFGFVTFADHQSAARAVREGPHKIDDKNVDVKLCDPPNLAKNRSSRTKNDNCKVFVGGLPHGITEEEIKMLMSRFGVVKDFKMKYDENKQRPRGFGFVTFESEESAVQALQEHYINLNGKQIEIKPQKNNVKQQQEMNYLQQQQQPQQHNFANQQNFASGMQWTPWVQNAAPLQQPQGANNNMGINNNNWNAYGGQLGGINQWGYLNQSTPQQSQIQNSSYSNNNAANGNVQSNWNYLNYTNQPQGFYQADSTGTDHTMSQSNW